MSSDKPPNAHLNSAIIFVRYENEQVSGQPRAAFVTEGPFVIPEGPHAGRWGAHIMYMISKRGDPENYDPVYVNGVSQEGWGVLTGLEYRMNVPYDPTGLEPRSWHVWGEAEGES